MEISSFVAGEVPYRRAFSKPSRPGSGPGTLRPNSQKAGDADICISNISPRERLKRLIGGVIPFVIAIGALAWLVSADVDRLWRLPLFFLFVAAASGYFQWRDKT